MPTVRDVLATKNSAVVYTCPPAVSLAEACRLMRERGVGCLVVAEGAAVEGLLSDREVVRAVASGRDARRTVVREAMAADAPAVPLDAPLDDVARLLRRRRARHAVVIGERGLLGVVSQGDLARFYGLRERAFDVPAPAAP